MIVEEVGHQVWGLVRTHLGLSRCSFRCFAGRPDPSSLETSAEIHRILSQVRNELWFLNRIRACTSNERLIQVLQDIIHEMEENSMTAVNVEYVVSEIERIGWDRVIEIADDFSRLVISIVDVGGRTHRVDFEISSRFPSVAPKIQLDFPIAMEMEWSSTFRLTDCLSSVEARCQQLQPYLNCMDELHCNCWVIEPSTLPSYHITTRRVVIDQESSIVLNIRWDRPNEVRVALFELFTQKF